MKLFVLYLLDAYFRRVASGDHLMSGEHRFLDRIGQNYQSHKHVKHNRGEYIRGNVNSNTIWSYGTVFERAK